MKHSKTLLHTALLALLAAGTLHTQAQTPAAHPPDAPLPVPTATEEYKKHVALATAAATIHGTAELIPQVCDLPKPANPNDAPTPARNPLNVNPIEAAKAFDNLYYVGLGGVSAWAIKTSAGIILIDALNSSSDIDETLIPGMKKLGLDPSQIKYVIISHAHGDHYGGAQALVDKFHPRIISSDVDWAIMEGPPRFTANFSPAPKRDMTIVDGEKLTLGDTTITMYITPGHTPGTISSIFPVKDKGKQHYAAIWGGTSFNFQMTMENFKYFNSYAESATRLAEAARKVGADVMLSNHPRNDDTVIKFAAMKTQKPGDSNPWIVGTQAVQNFLTVASECGKARAASFKF